MGLVSFRLGTRARSIRGFTLMELMIVLALAAVILAIGAPNFREFRQNNRLTATANDFLASVQLARTEAVKRQTNVSICPSDDPAAADPSCSGGEFSRWIVFEDDDGDCARGAGEPVIRAEAGRDTAPRSELERARQLRATADGSCVSIGRTGFTRDLDDSATRFVFCDARGIDVQPGTEQSLGRGILLNRTGRAQTTRDPTLIASWELPCPP
jgi:prepilin-type N-terminal cleavage/methylation domain-containing protein